MGNLKPDPTQPRKSIKTPEIAEEEIQSRAVDDEERDEFHMDGPTLSRSFSTSSQHHHHPHGPPKSLSLMKGPNTSNPLLLQIHPRFQSNPSGTCIAPPSTPQQGSAPTMPAFPAGPNHDPEKQDSRKISRSISDSTLRRAALHLNLTQSVLPSFISIQQFKVSVQITQVCILGTAEQHLVFETFKILSGFVVI